MGLRDELWRVWLLVEYQIRRGWETGVLPRIGDLAALGPCTPDHLAALFRTAQADYSLDLPTTTERSALWRNEASWLAAEGGRRLPKRTLWARTRPW